MNNKEQIEACVQLYYDGCCESDAEKIKQSFDDNAMISGYLPCLLYTSPSPRDRQKSRMPSSA